MEPIKLLNSDISCWHKLKPRVVEMKLIGRKFFIKERKFEFYFDEMDFRGRINF